MRLRAKGEAKRAYERGVQPLMALWLHASQRGSMEPQRQQGGPGINRLSKAESILGTWMSQNLSRGQRRACHQRTCPGRSARPPGWGPATGLLTGAFRRLEVLSGQHSFLLGFFVFCFSNESKIHKLLLLTAWREMYFCLLYTSDAADE